MLPLHSFTLNFGFSLRAAPSLCYERIIIRISNHTKIDKKPRWGVRSRKKQCWRLWGAWAGESSAGWLKFGRCSGIALYFRRMRKQSIPNFIVRAWEMLEDEGNWSAVAWNESGSAFEVINEAQFCSELLPRYFRHSNLSSFVRQVRLFRFQLNMYSFHKRRTAANTTEFHHTLFRRNHR